MSQSASDQTNGEASPSAGWREVYQQMDVGGARRTTQRRSNDDG
jgi:hypothetical protein